MSKSKRAKQHKKEGKLRKILEKEFDEKKKIKFAKSGSRKKKGKRSVVYEKAMPEYKIKEVTYNKGKRKGDYWYISQTGAKRGRYYKKREGVTKEEFLEVYQGKGKIGRGDKIKWSEERLKSKSPEEYAKKKLKTRDIDEYISKGISENGKIDDLAKTDRLRVREAYVDMLRSLVKDKDLLKVLTLPENVEKFKHRIEMAITLISKDNKVSVEFRTFGKSVDDVMSDLGKVLDRKDMWRNDMVILKKKGFVLKDIKGTDVYEVEDTKEKVLLKRNFLKYIKVKVKLEEEIKSNGVKKD